MEGASPPSWGRARRGRSEREHGDGVAGEDLVRVLRRDRRWLPCRARIGHVNMCPWKHSTYAFNLLKMFAKKFPRDCMLQGYMLASLNEDRCRGRRPRRCDDEGCRRAGEPSIQAAVGVPS